jgi:YD repeat-containing protein
MKLLVFIFTILAATKTMAGVNLKNGNFYVNYTDIVSTSQGYTLDITRTYNSKSTEIGWFGYGWGTPYEVRLEESSDGSLVVYENGTAGMVRFVGSKEISAADVDKTVEKIVKAISAKTKLTATATTQLTARLKENDLLRHKVGSRYGVTANLAVGTVLTSQKSVADKIEIMKQGYKRSFGDGLVQFFNKQGQLIQTQNPNGYKIKIVYGKDKKSMKLEDSAGNQLAVVLNGDGYISSVTGRGTQKASYKYNGKSLIEATNINKDVFEYQYDSFFNLVRITDKSVKDPSRNSIMVKYQPKTMFAEEVIDRDGSSVKYVYESNAANKDLEYSTAVVEKGSDGKYYANKYEYAHKKRADGSQWLYRTVFTTGADWNDKSNKLVGGMVKDTIYSECCGQPEKITQGDMTTTFKYNGEGLLLSRETNKGEFSRLEYNKNNRISKVTNNHGTYHYDYNPKGELTKASGSNGQSLLIVYDAGGKMTKIAYQNKTSKANEVLDFKYNSMGKPVEIAVANVGKVNLEYDNAGQVKSVNDGKNENVTKKLNIVLENFSNLVQPAGVNLSL